jgi:hypothetical protein
LEKIKLIDVFVCGLKQSLRKLRIKVVTIQETRRDRYSKKCKIFISMTNNATYEKFMLEKVSNILWVLLVQVLQLEVYG